MNILEETFAAHEHLAPAGSEVLRELHRRTARPHRRAPRLLAVAGVGATVAAVAAGSVVLGGTSTPPSAVPPQSTSAAATHRVAPPPPAPKVETRIDGPDHNTFGAGWLPSSTVTVPLATNSLKWGQEIQYDMTADGHDVTVLIQYDNATTLETRGKTGPEDGTHGTYEGHPSVEWDSGGYWKFTYQLDAAHTVIVEVIVDDLKGSGAAAIGTHVTSDLRFDLDTPIDAGGYLTYLPAGVHLASVSQQDSGVGWSVARDGVDEDESLVQTFPVGGTGATGAVRPNGPQPSGTTRDTGTPGRPVQGHPSTVDDTGGPIVLTVEGLLPGRTVQFLTSPAVPTLDDLYAIADGLRQS